MNKECVSDETCDGDSHGPPTPETGPEKVEETPPAAETTASAVNEDLLNSVLSDSSHPDFKLLHNLISMC